jgi:hypothetical protein
MNVLASSFSVSGAHGVITLLAVVAFAVAAVIAWVIAPRAVVLAFIALGLALLALAMLWH